eukprot:TRINITY_DN90602_c0_g1_i1.p2 TRINITY_DN90602_c0_g1~~TRINITY_DN90602_c0_g1_i1.p2  ORF type:complete len:186 (+),score=29.55 TRINITY_DN90602_c0_g1_i1:500-1057(+)
MQLLDELPILYVILTAFWCLWERASPAGQYGFVLPLILTFAAIVLSAILLATSQQSQLHQVARGVMTCTFTVCFVYVFWASATLSTEHGERSKSDAVRKIFSTAFLVFVAAIISWFVDNTLCDSLQRLPIYPNLHATVWHIGSASGMYLLFVALLLHRQSVLGIDCRVVHLGGVFPVARTCPKTS